MYIFLILNHNTIIIFQEVFYEKLKIIDSFMTTAAILCACSTNTVSKQTRTDLTGEHFNGLYADMKRSDVEDLIGKSDSALAKNESVEMYSLADGTTALLRYAGDKLQAAYIRGKDNVEKVLFNNYSGHSTNNINDKTHNTTNDKNQNPSNTHNNTNQNPNNTNNNTNQNPNNTINNTNPNNTTNNRNINESEIHGNNRNINESESRANKPNSAR